MNRKRIEFYSTQDAYGEFSNFWDRRMHKREYGTELVLLIDNLDWKSTEEYFQAQKFLGPEATDMSREYVEIIRKTDTAAKQAALARQRAAGRFIGAWHVDSKSDRRKIADIIKEYNEKGLTIRTDWERVKDGVMKKALQAKYGQNDALKKLLLDTRDALLVEHTPRDSYWGDGGDGSGNNMLGKLLMEVRAELS